jgi:hypothetical protein
MRRRLVGFFERAVLGLFMTLGALLVERLLRRRMRPRASPVPPPEPPQEG